MLDCTSCEKHTDKALRREMGCGWLPRAENPAAVWSGQTGALENRTCPGYTTELPDVIDVARVYWWADKGSIRDRLGGEPPEAIINGVDVLRCAIGDVEHYRIEKAKERSNGSR